MTLNHFWGFAVPRLFCLLLVCFVTLGGCAAATIDQSTGKYKGVFYEPAPRDEIRAALGEPSEVYEFNGKKRVAASYSIAEFDSYDVFDVKGKIYKNGAGNRAAMESAATLGFSELIFVPITLVKWARESFKKHKIVVYYDENKHYIVHQIFDENGEIVSISE